MSESPAFEQEKDRLVLFLQANSNCDNVRIANSSTADVWAECSISCISSRWLPRRPQALHDSETQYDAHGRPILPDHQRKCQHSIHVLEGYMAGHGVAVSCYDCYRTFYWSMKRRQYMPVNFPGPLPEASDEVLEGFLASSQRYRPDFIDLQQMHHHVQRADRRPISA